MVYMHFSVPVVKVMIYWAYIIIYYFRYQQICWIL